MNENLKKLTPGGISTPEQQARFADRCFEIALEDARRCECCDAYLEKWKRTYRTETGELCHVCGGPDEGSLEP